jgi:hypothetical protein
MLSINLVSSVVHVVHNFSIRCICKVHRFCSTGVCKAIVAGKFLLVVASHRDVTVLYCIDFLPFLLNYLSEVRLRRSVIMVLFSFLES